MGNAKKFFEELVKTDEAKVLLANTEAPKSDEDRIAAYIEIAKKLGVELTAEEIMEYYASSCVSDSHEIDDKELEQLVGGGENAQCGYSYIKDENCLITDQCNKWWQEYAISDEPSNEQPAKRDDRIWAEIFSLNSRTCGLLITQKKYDAKMASMNKK